MLLFPFLLFQFKLPLFLCLPLFPAHSLALNFQVWTGVRSLKYLQQGIASLKKGRLEVAALDATAIGVSILRRDMNTASSIMFLLGIGELLEELPTSPGMPLPCREVIYLREWQWNYLRSLLACRLLM